MVLYDAAQQRWRLHDLMRDLAGGHGERRFSARRRTSRHGSSRPAGGMLATIATFWRRRTASTCKGGEKVLSGLALFDRERRTHRNWAGLGGGLYGE